MLTTNNLWWEIMLRWEYGHSEVELFSVSQLRHTTERPKKSCATLLHIEIGELADQRPALSRKRIRKMDLLANENDIPIRYQPV